MSSSQPSDLVAGPSQPKISATSPTSDAQRPTKRKRRALSCTECIRRKTRCSALGQVPCESCIKRGKPGDCRWDNLEAGLGSTGAASGQTPLTGWASPEEVASLKAEIERLKAQASSRSPESSDTSSLPMHPPVHQATVRASASYGSHLPALNAVLEDEANLLPLLAITPSHGQAAHPNTQAQLLPPLKSVQTSSAYTSSAASLSSFPAFCQIPPLLPHRPLNSQSHAHILSAGGQDSSTCAEDPVKLESTVSHLETFVVGGSTPRPESSSIFNMLSLPGQHSSSSASARAVGGRGSSNFPSALVEQEDVWWDAVEQVLPGRDTGEVLVAAYLESPFHKNWHVLIGHVFLKEVVAFHGRAGTARQRGVDPAWLSLYLMVLALGVKSLTLDEVASVWLKYELREIAQLSKVLHEASLLALKIGRCDAVPQIRQIQTSLLCVIFLFHFGPASSGTSGVHHLSNAINTLQWLSLDRLSSPSKLPDDPALRGLREREKWELIKVLYHSASLQDGTTSRRFGVCRMAEMDGDPLTTPLPELWNDADLLVDPSEGRKTVHWCDSSTARLGSLFATENRKWMREVEREGKPTLESVSRYDEGLRSVLVQVPRPELEPAGVLNWMQCVLICSINNRLLRAHRPFMAIGYTDPKYAYSQKVALHSAKEIIAVQKLLMAAPQYRPTFVNRWILGAAFVLALDYAMTIDSPLPSTQKRQPIVCALEMFRQPNPTDPTPDVTEQCARTVQALLETMTRWQEAKVKEAIEGKTEDMDLSGFFRKVGELLAEFTDRRPQDPVITSSSLASLQNPEPPLPLDFDWSLLLNSGAFPDGMTLEQASSVAAMWVAGGAV